MIWDAVIFYEKIVRPKNIEHDRDSSICCCDFNHNINKIMWWYWCYHWYHSLWSVKEEMKEVEKMLKKRCWESWSEVSDVKKKEKREKKCRVEERRGEK